MDQRGCYRHERNEARESRALLGKDRAIWDVNERSVLAPQAFSQTERLFTGHGYDDNSGVGNEVDDSAPEKSADFSSATITNVDSETGVVTSQEAEQEAEVEEQLVAAVVAHAVKWCSGGGIG